MRRRFTKTVLVELFKVKFHIVKKGMESSCGKSDKDICKTHLINYSPSLLPKDFCLVKIN